MGSALKFQVHKSLLIKLVHTHAHTYLHTHTHTHTHPSSIANNSDVETIRYTIIKICILENIYMYAYITEMNTSLHTAIAQVIVFSFIRSKTFRLCQILKIC